MIYELRTYQLAVGGMADYLDLIRTKLLPLLAEHGIKPVGFWTTDIGTLNEVVHLWAFNDLNERQAKWGAWFKDPRRAEIIIAAFVFLHSYNLVTSLIAFVGAVLALLLILLLRRCGVIRRQLLLGCRIVDRRGG